MSTNVPNNQEDQEIDLNQVSKKIGKFFDWIGTSIFKGIQFFIRNAILVFVLVLVGFGLGLYLDKTQKSYEHSIIVQPNFGSVDYLYSKIDLIESKIKSKDTLFLKNVVGIVHPKRLSRIEIEPIADVYNFIKNTPENFELIKLMADNGDIKKIIEDNVTSKNYTYHTILFESDRLISDKEIAEPLISFLNESEYFKKIKKVSLKNIEVKMKQNDTIISQINNVLGSFSATANVTQKNDKLVYYNENTQLNDVIKTKDLLVVEQGIHQINLLGSDKIIKDVTITLNIKKIGLLHGNKKIALPILFIVLFILVNSSMIFYKKQSLIAMQSK
nr:hypothetical protein [uncultured Flavobacterium sp.]